MSANSDYFFAPPVSEAEIAETKPRWVGWLTHRGADKFYDDFVAIAQYAESRCANCREPIYLDIVEGGGAPDWRTEDGDYGCPDSPETDRYVGGVDGGTGGHIPRKLRAA